MIRRRQRNQAPLQPQAFGRLEEDNRTNGAGTVYYQVRVPENVRPGTKFRVFCDSRLVTVRAPANASPGQLLQITVPTDQPTASQAPLPVNPVAPRENGTGNFFSVRVPYGIRAGQEFAANVDGRTVMVTCPANTSPGDRVHIVLPDDEPKERKQQQPTKTFEVTLPAGVEAGRSIAIMAGGDRILIKVPADARAGQKVRFKYDGNGYEKKAFTAVAQLEFAGSPWRRTVCDEGKKMVWTCSPASSYAIEPSFVRSLERQHTDDRHSVHFLPVADVSLDPKVRTSFSRNLIDYTELVEAQRLPFVRKCKWFREKCRALRIDYSKGHIKIKVRRDHILEDSIMAVRSLSRQDLLKIWRVTFIGEEGLDAGGLFREWFELVSKAVLNPEIGLWSPSPNNPEEMEINSASGMLAGDDSTAFEFFGRVLGKALLDGNIVSGRFPEYLLKHLLGWPINLHDLQSVDTTYYNGLSQLSSMVDQGEDLGSLFLNFTVTQEAAGESHEVELIDGGADVSLTNQTLPQYLEESLKHRVFGRIRPQLAALLTGFFDTVPEPLLAVFDPAELELLLCGSRTIDLADWKQNTVYGGDFETLGSKHPTCTWFWEIVESFDEKLKRALLHFATGSSGVPGLGFAYLQGDDGSIHKFQLTSSAITAHPVSHTCFNRIDMPECRCMEELREKLLESMENGKAGFLNE